MDNIIVIKTQAEFDALPEKFSSWTVIEIRAENTFWLTVKKVPLSSRVEAWGSSRVEAWGSSRVEAWGSSRVEAWESSRVEAWESSQVVARESSRVEAWGSSRVEAWGSSAIYAHSADAIINLFVFAVCFAIEKAKILKKSKTCTIITPRQKKGIDGWLESQAIAPAVTVILFKRVSKDWKTQEGTAHETLWAVGTAQEHPAWDPKASECGAGKFHACSRPYFCDEFRSKEGDRYVAIAVAQKDLYAWPDATYPHKVAFRKGTVLHEVDRWGEKVATAVPA